MPRIVQTIVVAALGYAAVMAWVGVARLGLRATRPEWEVLAGLLAAAVAILGAVASWRWRGAAVAKVDTWLGGVTRLDAKQWLVIAIGVGLALRVAWVLLFPAAPSSDGATYVALAESVSEGRPYLAGGTVAYWPPGYPLFLAPWLTVLDDPRSAVVASNLAAFVIGAVGVAVLAHRLASQRAGGLSAMVFALWPNLIFQAGLPEKEQILAAMLPWVLVGAVASANAVAQRPAAGLALLAGVTLGACVLVQPALVLFPSVLVAAWVLCDRRPQRIALLTLSLAMGMAAVILPWSIRNVQVLGQFVLVSTNGGIGLYGANNPRANGGYYEYWAESDLMSMPELVADREGKRRAIAWIRDNPGAFARLAFEKNTRFMGDDAAGAYQTFRRGDVPHDLRTYAVAKGGANVYWLALWSVLLVALTIGGAARWSALQALPAGAFLYAFALHSVAESAGKYHVLMTGVLAVLLAVAVETATQAKRNARIASS